MREVKQPWSLPPQLHLQWMTPNRGHCLRGGGIQRLQRARIRFLLPIRESNHLCWFMSHHNIYRGTNPHRHHCSRLLVVLFPLCRHPFPLASSTWTVSHTSFRHHVMGVQGGDILLVGGAPAPVAAHPTPPSRPAGGASGPSVARGVAGGGGGGSSPPRGGAGPSFRHSGGPAQTRREDGLKHTCGCPRCVVHYETCIQSLMAQVQDLQTQNLQLQRSQQELSQAVASTAGISQSYGDRITQLLSTLPNFEAMVQGYQRDSKAVPASVLDHVKTSSSTAECFSSVETIAMPYADVASRIDAWDHSYAIPPPPSAPPPVPDPEPAAPTAPIGGPSGSPSGGCVLPFSVQPSHDCMYHPNACPDLEWPGGGRNTTNSPITRNLLRGGVPPKSRMNLLSPSRGRRLRRRIPLGAYSPVDRY